MKDLRAMRWNILPSLCLLCSLGSVGCIDYSETLELRADGSGTLTVRQTVDLMVLDQVKQLLSAMGKARKSPLPEFDKASIEAALQGREGLTVRSIEVTDREEKGNRFRDIVLVVDFRSPSDLVVGELGLLIRPFSFASETAGDRTTHRFERQVGIGAEDVRRLTNWSKEKAGDKGEKDPLELGDEELEGFRSLAQNVLAGKKASFELRMPGSIDEASVAEGNGKVEGRAAFWNFDLVDLIARSHDLRATSSETTTGSEGEDE